MYMYVESLIMKYEYETSWANSEMGVYDLHYQFCVTPLHTLAIQHCVGAYTCKAIFGHHLATVFIGKLPAIKGVWVIIA